MPVFRLLCLSVALLTASPGPVVGQQDAGVTKLIPPVPTPASFVADMAGVLSVEEKAAIDGRIRGIQTAGLGDIGVALLKTIGDNPPVEVGVAIYRNWKIGSRAAIGDAHRDVGLLILIVVKELNPDGRGECFINTGNGAEGIVTDGAAASICREVIIPLLKDKAHAQAVLAGITALEARLRGDEGLATETAPQNFTSPSEPEGNDVFHWWQIPLGLIAVAGTTRGVRRWRRNRPRNCPKCFNKMSRLDEKADNEELTAGQLIEEKIRSIDYDVWMCSCGGELVVPYKKWLTKYSACRECKHRTAWSRRRTIISATTSSSGMAELNWQCEACPAKWQTQEVIPRISTSSSSSGGSSGGGSSFGGSGSTSGGGGGGSY